MILRYLCLSGLVAAALSGCEPAKDNAAGNPPTPEITSQRPTVLFLGTSLTAGYGIDPELAYPALIQRRIDSAGLSFQVVNAGVSGETSAGALRRVDWLLEQQPVSVLVIETGANDVLVVRGERERLIPFVQDRYVIDVDLEGGCTHRLSLRTLRPAAHPDGATADRGRLDAVARP
jgi:lysophospholipase L1-like esterase